VARKYLNTGDSFTGISGVGLKAGRSERAGQVEKSIIRHSGINNGFNIRVVDRAGSAVKEQVVVTAALQDRGEGSLRLRDGIAAARAVGTGR